MHQTCTCSVGYSGSIVSIHPDPTCPIHGDNPKTEMYVSPCEKCASYKLENARLVNALLDMWYQFAYGDIKKGFDSGGLSALEDAQDLLEQLDLIDGKGLRKD